MKNAKHLFGGRKHTHAETQMSKTVEGRGWLMEDSLCVGSEGGVGEGLRYFLVSVAGLMLGCCLQSSLQLSEEDKDIVQIRILH